jgi:hypothetical protein
MGVLAFADTDIDAEMAGDEAAAADFDAQRRHVEDVAAGA